MEHPLKRQETNETLLQLQDVMSNVQSHSTNQKAEGNRRSNFNQVLIQDPIKTILEFLSLILSLVHIYIYIYIINLMAITDHSPNLVLLVYVTCYASLR